MKISVTLFAFIFWAMAVGCNDASNPFNGGTQGGPVDTKPGTFSVHDAAGNADSTCLQITDGSALNGDSYNYTFALGNDGTYNFYVSFYTGTACEFGGTEIMSMEQGGIYSVTAHDGHTNVLAFTQSSDALLTVYGGSSPGSKFAGYLNSSCGSPALKFSGSATVTQVMSGRTCARASDPALHWPPFPSATGSSKTIGIFSLNPHTLTIGKPANYWLPGSPRDLPTRADLVFTYF